MASFAVVLGVLTFQVAVAARPASAAQVTSWVGLGTGANDDYDWNDPANWDAGVPTQGADVTLAPTVTTHILHVPGIGLSSLHLIGTGEVDYDLSVDDPASWSSISIANSFEWRSGTLGPGLGIWLYPGAVGSIQGDVATQDRAVLNGWIDVSVGASLHVGLLGAAPTSRSDATLRVGKAYNTGGAWTGVITLDYEWDMPDPPERGVLALDDGVRIVADQAGSPGEIAAQGEIVAYGPTVSGVDPVGVTLDGIDLTWDDPGEIGATVAPGAQAGAQPGDIRFLDMHAQMYGSTLFGGGTVTIADGSYWDFVGGPVRLTDGTTFQLGESASNPVTLQSPRIWPLNQLPADGQVVWVNAAFVGSAAEVRTPLKVVNSNPKAVHTFNTELDLGDALRHINDEFDGVSVTGGLIVILPGVTLDVVDSVTLATSVENRGTVRSLDGATLRLPPYGDWANGGLLSLGRGELLAGTFENQPSGIITTQLTGSDPIGEYGHIDSSSVIYGGTFRATAGSYRPDPGVSLRVIAGAPATSDGFDVIELPGQGWQGDREDGGFSLSYTEPLADLSVKARPADAQIRRGEITALRATISNAGPFTSEDARMRLDVDGGLRIVGFGGEAVGCTDEVGTPCTVGPIGVGQSVKVTIFVRGLRTGKHHLAVHVGPVDLDPDRSANNATVAVDVGH